MAAKQTLLLMVPLICCCAVQSIVYRKPKPIEIPLKNVDNENYYAEVQLGTPLQRVNLLVDTEYSDTWILFSSYPGCNEALNNKHNCYKPAKSKTSDQRQFRLELLNDLVLGREQEETFKLGNKTLERIPFIGADDFGQSDDVLASAQDLRLVNDGFLGVGKRRQLGDGVTQLLARLKQFDYIERRIVSIYTKHTGSISPERANSTLPIDGGKVLLGGVDPSFVKSKTVITAPTVHEDFVSHGSWDIFIDDFSSENSTLVGKTIASLSTRYNYIGVPQKVLEIINKQVNGQLDKGGSIQVADCNLSRLPSYSFRISGSRLTLEPKDYALKIEGTNNCRLAFDRTQSTNGQWFSFGTYFMSLYYTVLNSDNTKHSSVSFARIS